MRHGSLPDAEDLLLDEAETALDQGDPQRALTLCDGLLRSAPQHAGALFVRGDALRAMARLEEAAVAYRAAAVAEPEHASSWASLALTVFELLRFDEAQRASARALRADPASAEAWWVRALLAEWRGDMRARERALAHARWLDPGQYPIPVELSAEEIEDVVSTAVEELHPDIQEYLANVAILLEDMPSESILRSFDPPASPLDLLGFFGGHPVGERGGDDPWSQLPPTIYLFRRNLERHAVDRDNLIEELRITVFHEVGHFLGLDEDDLGARGLD
jgi:predicted Zn-dependent protease with MMP-like domain